MVSITSIQICHTQNKEFSSCRKLFYNRKAFTGFLPRKLFQIPYFLFQKIDQRILHFIYADFFLNAFFFSRFVTTMQQLASPVIFTVVRPISKIRSTPATRAIPSTGSPTDVSTIASITIPDPGTPAVPIDASVAVRIIVSICGSVRLIP